jgi:hypothetical protein
MSQIRESPSFASVAERTNRFNRQFSQRRDQHSHTATSLSGLQKGSIRADDTSHASRFSGPQAWDRILHHYGIARLDLHLTNSFQKNVRTGLATRQFSSRKQFFKGCAQFELDQTSLNRISPRTGCDTQPKVLGDQCDKRFRTRFQLDIVPNQLFLNYLLLRAETIRV